MQQAVARFKKLFRGRKTSHGQYIKLPDDDPREKIAKTLKQGPSQELWVNHLDGVGPFLGIVPLTEANRCYWGAIDYDDVVDTFEMDKRVRTHGLPLIVCRSKSGGAHLYVFFNEPVEARTVIDKLKSWAVALGIARNAPDKTNRKGRPVEVFPKQATLGPDEVGNWINLPYYGGDATDRYAVYNGKRLSLLEFLDVAESSQLTEDEFESLSSSSPSDPFADGPPCLQALHAQGVIEGMRNQTLFNIALFFKLANPEAWEHDVSRYNNEYVDPPLPDDELDTLIRSVRANNYVYKCNDAPLESECNKGLCVKRKWGIRAFQKNEAQHDMPEVSDLIKIKTDPPLWLVRVRGRQIEVDTDTLISPLRFRRVCLEKLSIIIPNVKQRTWDDLLQSLLDHHTEVDAPEDAGLYGEFRNLLDDFIEKRLAARGRDDILLGKPYEEGGRVYFRSQDLTAHLRRKNFREYTTNRIYTTLRDMGANHHQMKLRGACVQVWSLPIENGRLQTEPFDLPSNDGGEPSF